MKRILIIISLLVCGGTLAHGVIRGGGTFSVSGEDVLWTDPDAASLVAVWYLQETVQPDGDLDDIHTNDLDAPSVGALFFEGKDSGYRMGGAGQYFNAGTNFGNAVGDLVSNLSFAARVKFNLTSGNDGIFNIGNFSSTHGEFAIAIVSDKLRFTVDNAGADLQTSFTRTDENHIAATYDGETLRLYTNGIEHSTLSYTSSLDCNGLSGIIGGYFGSSFVLDGRINDIRFYGRTITSNEVGTLSDTAVGSLAIDTISTNNLIAFYPATNNTMGADDNSGNYLGAMNRPTFANDPTYAEIAGTNSNGRVQYAIRGDGSDDRLTVFDANDSDSVLDFGTNDFTIMAWINQDTLKANRIAGKGVQVGINGYALLVDNIGVVSFIVDGGSRATITNDSVITTNQWYHVVGVRDYNSELSMWIDGIKQANTNNETLDLSSTDEFSIFNLDDVSAACFDGLIANVRIYDIVITNIPAIHTNTYMPNGDIEARLSNP